MNEQDQFEASQIQDALTMIKDCSNRVIDYAIKELNDEKRERKQAQGKTEADTRD